MNYWHHEYQVEQYRVESKKSGLGPYTHCPESGKEEDVISEVKMRVKYHVPSISSIQDDKITFNAKIHRCGWSCLDLFTEHFNVLNLDRLYGIGFVVKKITTTGAYLFNDGQTVFSLDNIEEEETFQTIDEFMIHLSTYGEQ